MIQFVTVFICINEDYLFLFKNRTLLFFYKPGVAGTVLQTSLWFNDTQFEIDYISWGKSMADLGFIKRECQNFQLFDIKFTRHLENIKNKFLDLKIQENPI